MTIDVREGNMPHLYWIDLKGDGVYTECAVMKRDALGNIYFFPVNYLDSIDKKRLARILSNRNATHFELWDLMSNITLNNGVNALAYFHQLVQVVTPSGKVMKPQEGVVGVNAGGTLDTRSVESRKAMEEAAAAAANAAATAAATAAAAAVTQANNPQPTTLNEDAPAPEKTTTRGRGKKKTEE